MIEESLFFPVRFLSKQFKLLRSQKQLLLPVAVIVLIAILLPAVIFVALQRQENRSSAYGGANCRAIDSISDCVPNSYTCAINLGQQDCDAGEKCAKTCYPPSPSPTPRPTATPSSTCSYPAQTCSKPGIRACNVNGQYGTQICTYTRCTSSSPYDCSLSPTNCGACQIASPRPTPRPSSTPSPSSGTSCIYPGQSCTHTGIKACKKNGLPGTQTCTYTICGTGNVCSQSPQNCTSCVTFTPDLNTGCRESCIAAGNTPSECNGYPSCGTIHLSCSGKPNKSRCQLSNGLGFCQNGICVADLPVNSNCSNGNQCDFGLACISGKCRQVNLANNATCVAGVQCQSRLCLGGKCQAMNLNNGQTCMYDAQCKSGSCTQAGSGPKTCQVAPYVGRFPANPGHFCGTTSFATYYCTGSYTCKKGICRKNGQLGAACTIGADCASGRCLGRQCTGINPDEVGLVPGFNLSSSPLTESQYYAMMLEKIQDCKDACTTNACRNQCETNVYNEVLYYSTLDSEQAVNECIMLERFYGDTRPISQLQRDCNTAVDSGGIAIATGAISAYATFNNPSAWSSVGEAGRHAAREIGARASQGAASIQIWLSRIAQATSWYLVQNQNIPERVMRAPELLDLASCVQIVANELGDGVNDTNWQNISVECAAVAQNGTQNNPVDDIVRLIR